MADRRWQQPNIRSLPTRRRGEEEDSLDEEEIRAEQKRARRTRRRVILAVLLFVVLGTAAFLLFRRYAVYTTYSVEWQKDVSQGSLVGYEPFGGGLLKYSKDGVTFVSGRGEELWVDTYEMKNPMLDINGDYAVIADRQGISMRIYNSAGRTGSAETLRPLTRAAVSGNGTVAVIEEDASASYIYFYDKNGTELDITIKSILAGDGYPTDLALSPDGTGLMVGYQYLSGGELSGRAVFYDFSEVGKNIPNRLVGGFDEPFAGSLIADVCCMNATNCFAASTAGLSFFSRRNRTSPELVKQVDEADEIRTLFYNDEYVCVVLNNSASAERYRLEVYKPDGSLVLTKEFSMNYTGASVSGDYVFLFSANEAMIINMAGTEKFHGALDFQVVQMRTGSVPGEFIMAGTSNVKGVRLR